MKVSDTAWGIEALFEPDVGEGKAGECRKPDPKGHAQRDKYRRSILARINFYLCSL